MSTAASGVALRVCQMLMNSPAYEQITTKTLEQINKDSFDSHSN